MIDDWWCLSFMTVYEYSIKVNKTVDEILMLCKKLGINVSSKDDILSTEDIMLLDKNLPNITSASASTSTTTTTYGSGDGGKTTAAYSTPEKSTEESVDSTSTQNTNSDISIDPECLVKECNLIKNIAKNLSSFSESINSVNINGTESINNDLLTESKNIGSVLDSQKKMLSSMVTGVNELQERIVNVKTTLEQNNPELALLFAWLDTERIDEFNKSNDVVEDTEHQTTSKESDLENNDKSVDSTTTVDKSSSEFEKTLDTLDNGNNAELKSSPTYLKPKNNSDISHRGYTHGDNKYYYENSVGAFTLAGEKGFWGCETDVRLDDNGVLVCKHNKDAGGRTPPAFEEYLDVCKEYGMTAIIDLKYNTTSEPKLAEGIIKTIEEKGMLDNCILQTNNHNDIPHIRELSEDARIWYLADTPDLMDTFITPYNVEGVNICAYAADFGTTLQSIKTFVNNGIDVCVWGVTTESSKQKYLDAGASHVMSDYVLGITPYQEGEFDYNGIEN